MRIRLKDLGMYMFCVAYSMFLAFSLLGHIATLGGYLKLATNAAMGIMLFAFVIRIRHYQVMEVIVLVCLFLLAFIQIRETTDYALFKLTLFLTASKDLDLKKCLKFDLVMRIILMGMLFFLNFAGIAPDVQAYYGGTYRHSLGFTNPNALGMAVLILCLEILYLSDFKLNVGRLLIICALFVFSDYFAGSRTTSAIIVLAIAMAWLYHRAPHVFRRRALRVPIFYGILLFAAFMFVAMFLFATGNPWARELNRSLSNRLYNMAFYAKVIPYSLFGRNITPYHLALDNAYGYAWFGLGAVAFALYMFSFIRLQRSLYRQNDIPLAIVMFCFAVYGMSERLWMNVDYNMLMMAFGKLLYEKRAAG